MGRDSSSSASPRPATAFQSTRPVWGATVAAGLKQAAATFQSTRPVWGATSGKVSTVAVSAISIHAPRVGRDAIGIQAARIEAISIHAPRVGRDFSQGLLCFRGSYFNPRAPCGARLVKIKVTAAAINFNPRAPCGARHSRGVTCLPNIKFQSTRPVWGATLYRGGAGRRGRISIHAPRVGRDAGFFAGGRYRTHFNPRAPCGARLDVLFARERVAVISIHAPRVGRDDRI